MLSSQGWKRLLRIGAVVVLWTALFTIAYSQSPLYTSNQNQYFLHGLARAGYGSLNQDWLANTRDPTPIFSLLVNLSYRLFHSLVVTYLYYALLMGVYLFSLYGIADQVFGIGKTRLSSLIFLSLMIVVHAAGLRFAFSRWIGSNWAYILEDGVADQRMLGPVFQPSTFGVLLALSVYLFLRRKPLLAALAAALAAIFHPTYLLASGVLTASYMLVAYREQRRLAAPLWIGLCALIPVLPLLAYLWVSFGGESATITAQARQVLVEYRIPHHAIITEWLDLTVVVKVAIVVLCLFIVRQQRIFLVLLLPFLAASLLTLLAALIDSYGLALLFPWRISTLLVPLSTALLIAFLVMRLLRLPQLGSAAWQRALTVLSLMAVIASVLVGGLRFTLDWQRKAQDAERRLESYIYAQHSAGETYLTPVKMQDFRLFAGAPVYIDFKSIPYRDSDVLEWYRRVQNADRFYKTKDCDLLQSLAGEGVTHAVLAVEDLPLDCPLLQETYRDGDFIVYRLLPAAR
jgi:hypothetical protein